MALYRPQSSGFHILIRLACPLNVCGRRRCGRDNVAAHDALLDAECSDSDFTAVLHNALWLIRPQSVITAGPPAQSNVASFAGSHLLRLAAQSSSVLSGQRSLSCSVHSLTS